MGKSMNVPYELDSLLYTLEDAKTEARRSNYQRLHG